MKKHEVIDIILSKLPHLEGNIPDDYKHGNRDDECTGIVMTSIPTYDIIRQTGELGANLILAFQPSFYSHMDNQDYLKGDPVYEEKCALLDKYNITIWRTHDLWEAHDPNLLVEGIMQELGWADYLVSEKTWPHIYDLPKTTVRDLAEYLKKKMCLNGVRVIGDLSAEVSRVCFAGNIMPSVSFNEEYHTRLMMEKNIDVYIPAAMVDWTVAGYVNDASMQGRGKAIIDVGHANATELGWRYAVKWIREWINDEVPITWITSSDIYTYL